MFLRIVRVRSTEQSGIKGVKIPFDPNIIVIRKKSQNGLRCISEGMHQHFGLYFTGENMA